MIHGFFFFFVTGSVCGDFSNLGFFYGMPTTWVCCRLSTFCYVEYEMIVLVVRVRKSCVWNWMAWEEIQICSLINKCDK